MSGVALDRPVDSAKPRSFLRLLLAVVLGYIATSITLSLAALGLLALDVLPRPFLRPGPFPVDGAWSLDADLVLAAVVVLYAAWWIRRMVEDAVRGHVSFGVVALTVAVTGYAPFLTLRPVALSGIIGLIATTWIIRRYAIGTTMPFPRPSWRVWLAFAVVGVVVLGSYGAYHPLTGTGESFGASTFGSGKQYREISLKNSDWANLTILRVDGAWVGRTEGLIAPLKLPYTLHSRSTIGVFVVGRACVPREVEITFSVLGRTSTQRFAIQPDTAAAGFHSGAVPAC